MREVDAYQTSDGKLFLEEDKAKRHEDDILGEALDTLIANDDRGNVTRTDRFNIITKMMKDPELLNKVRAVLKSLEHGLE